MTVIYIFFFILFTGSDTIVLNLNTSTYQDAFRAYTYWQGAVIFLVNDFWDNNLCIPLMLARTVNLKEHKKTMERKTATCSFAKVVLIECIIIMWTVKYYLSTKSVVCPCKLIHFKISFYTLVIELVSYSLIETLLYVSNAWKELVLSCSVKASN